MIDDGPERGVFDQSHLAERVVREARAHLAPGGELWFVMSDMAELHKLRPANFWIDLYKEYGACERRFCIPFRLWSRRSSPTDDWPRRLACR